MDGMVDEKVGRPTGVVEKVAHHFRDLGISDWNRSKDCDLDKAYLEKLAENIKQNGLLCPIILVRDKKTGCLRVLAGAHRLAALKLLRGDDGGLYEGEFIILDIDESDAGCFAITTADNRYQRKSSLADTMVYLQRIAEERHVTQENIAKETGHDRQVVNRLLIFAKHIDKCLEPVKADLHRAPDNENEDGGPALTVYGVYEFVPALSKAGMTPVIAGMIGRAVLERWSTRKIRRAVQRYMERTDDAADGQADAPTQTTPRTLKPTVILSKAVKAVTKAEELMTEYGVLVEVSKLLADAKQILTMRLADLKSAKADKPVKGRKVKSAKAPKGNTPKSDASTGSEQPADTATKPVKRKRGRPRKAAAEPAPAITDADINS